MHIDNVLALFDVNGFYNTQSKRDCIHLWDERFFSSKQAVASATSDTRLPGVSLPHAVLVHASHSPPHRWKTQQKRSLSL